MRIATAELTRVVLVRLDPGDDLLDTLAAAARAEGITSGVSRMS